MRLFCILLFILCFLKHINCFDENQGYTVPGVGLLTYIVPGTIFDGFCLDEPDRAIQNFTKPLYPISIYQSYQGTHPPGVAWNEITMILIREVLGYDLFIVDNSAMPNPELIQIIKIYLNNMLVKEN